MCSIMKIYSTVFAVFLHESHIWKSFCFWDMAQISSANQIAEVFSQTYLQNKPLK